MDNGEIILKSICEKYDAMVAEALIQKEKALDYLDRLEVESDGLEVSMPVETFWSML